MNLYFALKLRRFDFLLSLYIISDLSLGSCAATRVPAQHR